MNATVTHTPGPWHVIDSYRNASANYKASHPRDILILAEDTSKASICEVASIPPSAPPPVHDRELANARLIAAAPDLLNLVRQYLLDMRFPVFSDESRIRRADAIEAVLAKVDGQHQSDVIGGGR